MFVFTTASRTDLPFRINTLSPALKAILVFLRRTDLFFSSIADSSAEGKRKARTLALQHFSSFPEKTEKSQKIC
jgi:hypothetical protein